MLSKIKKYLLNFLQTQLIVTIAAVPILVNWGLSLSLMTFVGNLAYAPILTIFLILSSMVFFTQLLHIPNHGLTFCLDQFIQRWDDILAHGNPDWLIEFCKPPTLFLVAIPVITFIILQFGKFKTIEARIGVMAGILTASMLGLWGIRIKDEIPSERCGRELHTLISIHLTPNGQEAPSSASAGLDIKQESDGKLTIIDNGFFRRRPSPEKAIEFELKPYLVKKFGKIRIKQLTIKRPGQRNFMAAKALCAIFPVALVVLTPIEKKLSAGGQLALSELTQLLEKKGIQLAWGAEALRNNLAL